MTATYLATRRLDTRLIDIAAPSSRTSAGPFELWVVRPHESDPESISGFGVCLFAGCSGWPSGWLLVAAGVEGEFAEEFAGGGVDDADLEGRRRGAAILAVFNQAADRSLHGTRRMRIWVTGKARSHWTSAASGANRAVGTVTAKKTDPHRPRARMALTSAGLTPGLRLTLLVGCMRGLCVVLFTGRPAADRGLLGSCRSRPCRRSRRAGRPRGKRAGR
jgi:hypothetical protein